MSDVCLQNVKVDSCEFKKGMRRIMENNRTIKDTNSAWKDNQEFDVQKIKIDSFLIEVYKKFIERIAGGKPICDLRKLNYEAGNTPDYNNVLLQEYYLLRYAFAYFYEYAFMYKRIIGKTDNPNAISIASFGCGNMIDYWSLVYAMKEEKNNKRIAYYGIDKVNWAHKFIERKFKDGKKDTVEFVEKDMVSYLKDKKVYAKDIIFFPNSISEIQSEELNKIVEFIGKKDILKDHFFLCVSLRENKESVKIDKKRVEKIQKAIEDKGFDVKETYEPTKEEKEDTFCSVDKIRYPNGIYSYIKNIDTRCNVFCEESNHCKGYGEFGRAPMLIKEHINYYIIEFERRDAK